MRSIDSYQQPCAEIYYDITKTPSNSIVPEYIYSITDYEELLSVIARGKLLQHDSTQNGFRVYYSSISSKFVEMISNSLIFVSKLTLLKKNIKLQQALIDVLRGFNNLNTSYVNIYNDMIKICSKEDTIDRIPIETRKRMLNIFLNVPDMYHNIILNTPDVNSSMNTNVIESRIWNVFRTYIKYVSTDDILKHKLLYNTLLNLILPLVIDQTYTFIASTLREQNVFNMKYSLKESFKYSPIETSYSSIFGVFRTHLISKESALNVSSFNKSCSEIFGCLNTLNSYINRIRTGDVFIDYSGTDPIETTLINNFVSARSNAHTEISKIIDTITIHMKRIRVIISSFKRNIINNESCLNYSEYERIVLEMFRKITLIIFTIHSTTRCVLGYNRIHKRKQ